MYELKWFSKCCYSANSLSSCKYIFALGRCRVHASLSKREVREKVAVDSAFTLDFKIQLSVETWWKRWPGASGCVQTGLLGHLVNAAVRISAFTGHYLGVAWCSSASPGLCALSQMAPMDQGLEMLLMLVEKLHLLSEYSGMFLLKSKKLQVFFFFFNWLLFYSTVEYMLMNTRILCIYIYHYIPMNCLIRILGKSMWFLELQ